MFFGQCTAAFADRGQTRLRAGLIAKSLVLAIVTVNCAHANPNLLPNGDFSNAEKISGWTGDPAGAVSLSPFDFGASASSGSLLVQGDVFTPGTATSSCFAIEPRTNYTFGGVYVLESLLVSEMSAKRPLPARVSQRQIVVELRSISAMA